MAHNMLMQLNNYALPVLTWEAAHYCPAKTWDHYALSANIWEQLNNYVIPVLTWEAANDIHVLPQIQLEDKEMKLWDINEH